MTLDSVDFWQYLFWVVLGGAGASYLVTRDGLFERLRDRVEEHFKHRQNQIFKEINEQMDGMLAHTAAEALVFRVLATESRSVRPEELKPAESRYAIFDYIFEQAQTEPARPLWGRLDRWSAWSARLQRQNIYSSAIRCASCTGFWMFLITAVVLWLLMGRFPTLAGLDVVYALPLLAFGLRWPYVLVAMRYKD